MAHRYLVENLADAAPGSIVELGGDEARHAVDVSRIRAGERLGIGDGRGVVVEGVVVHAERGSLRLEVDAVERTEQSAPELWLVQALAKGDRDEMAVQASTELGVAGVIPWAAARSVVRWEGPKREKALARWRTIVREASKQALRAHVPEVAPLAKLADLVRLAGESTVMLLDPRAETPIDRIHLDGAERVHLVVGPEGGIAPEEVAALVAAGAVQARLGANVLRASTAGPAAIAALHGALGRW
jgi:16S rRNA (uracil1498-N3)-methyltransferase